MRVIGGRVWAADRAQGAGVLGTDAGDVSWPVTMGLIVLGTALNGAAYYRYCKRFEQVYYPQYWSEGAQVRADDKECTSRAPQAHQH